MAGSDRVAGALGRTLLLTGVSLTSVMLLCSFGAVFGFDRVFVAFHLVAFAGRDWILPADSLTVALFPERFFLNGARLYGCWLGLATVAVWLSTSLVRGRRLRRKGRRACGPVDGRKNSRLDQMVSGRL